MKKFLLIAVAALSLNLACSSKADDKAGDKPDAKANASVEKLTLRFHGVSTPEEFEILMGTYQDKVFDGAFSNVSREVFDDLSRSMHLAMCRVYGISNQEMAIPDEATFPAEPADDFEKLLADSARTFAGNEYFDYNEDFEDYGDSVAVEIFEDYEELEEAPAPAKATKPAKNPAPAPAKATKPAKSNDSDIIATFIRKYNNVRTPAEFGAVSMEFQKAMENVDYSKLNTAAMGELQDAIQAATKRVTR